MKLWAPHERGFRQRPSESVRSRFYLRVLVQDKPGAYWPTCAMLADQEVSIASVIQHEAMEETQGDVGAPRDHDALRGDRTVSGGAGEDQQHARRGAARCVFLGGRLICLGQAGRRR